MVRQSVHDEDVAAQLTCSNPLFDEFIRVGGRPLARC